MKIIEVLGGETPPPQPAQPAPTKMADNDMPVVPVDPMRALTSPRTYMGAGSSNDPGTTVGAWAGRTGQRSGANDNVRPTR
jgi:hypothetical protein